MELRPADEAEVAARYDGDWSAVSAGNKIGHRIAATVNDELNEELGQALHKCADDDGQVSVLTAANGVIEGVALTLRDLMATAFFFNQEELQQAHNNLFQLIHKWSKGRDRRILRDQVRLEKGEASWEV